MATQACGGDQDCPAEQQCIEGECVAFGCGNAIVEKDEQCDEGGETARCNADCSFARCGDGIVNKAANEACDGLRESSTCNADCSAARCGDGVVNAAAREQCDDANADEWDGCKSDCSASCVSSSDCPASMRCAASRCEPLTFGPALKLTAELPFSSRSNKPQIVMDGAGNALLIWSPQTQGTFAAIYYESWHRPNIGWSTAKPFVEAPANGSIEQLRVVGNERGELLAVWIEQPDGAARRIRARWGNAAGWEAPFTVLNSETDGINIREYKPIAVTAGLDGEANIAWLGDAASSSVIYQASCTFRATTCPAQAVATTETSEVRLSLHGGRDGRSMLAFAEQLPSESRVGVIYPSEMGPHEEPLFSGPGARLAGESFSDSVYVDRYGRSVVAYAEGSETGPYTARTRTATWVEKKLTWQDPEIVPSSPGTLGTVGALLSGQPNGALWLLRVEASLSAGIYTGEFRASERGPTDVTFSSHDSKGGTFAGHDEFQIRSASDAANNGVVLWFDNDGTGVRLVYSRYETKKGFTSVKQTITERANDHLLDDLELAMQANGRGMAVWVDEGPGTWSLWASAME